jgi:hypothetical protein
MRRHKEPGLSEEQRAMREASTRLPHHHVVDIDPEDPTQQLDDLGEFHIEPLAVEAQPAAEASEDLDIAAAENVEGESELGDSREDVTGEAEADPYAATGHDTGDLYGVRTPHAGDTSFAIPEAQGSYEGSDLGEHWLEALEEHAAEMGPVPEEEIVIIDDSDEHLDHRGHHSTERDRPVADKGSGGPGGL